MSRGISGRVTRKPFGPAVGVLLIAALLIHCGGEPGTTDSSSNGKSGAASDSNYTARVAPGFV